jgi:eukaryotic-like serine/threonine-protein kinase
MTRPVDAHFLGFQEALAGRYSLERELGRGGMGIVYLAREVRLDRPVAIKLLPPEMAGDPGIRERFMRESRTAARLSHPSIVQIYTVDEVGDFVFYAMAYVDGTTLAERLASRGPMPAADVIRITREVAWALAHAHAQGVVHRDVKPANILIEHGTGRAMVTDFGIARLANAAGQTSGGELLGTPEYMSPEQASGEAVDGRSDLYSLGVMAYYALTGSLPFTGTVRAVLAQHITKPAPTLASVARGAPRALTTAVDRCLAKEPAKRFASGGELADALAPTLTKNAEVPPPIRAFLDWRRNISLLASAALWPVLIVAAADTPRVPILVPILVGGVMLGAPLAIVVERLRSLARLGYGTDDIVTGIKINSERRREELIAEFGVTPGRQERVMRRIALLGLPYGSACLATIILSERVAWLDFSLNRPALALPVFIGVGMLAPSLFAAVASERTRRLRSGNPSTWARFWRGALARVLGKLASFKLTDAQIPADRATELAIAMSAESLFASLGKDTRQLLGDVPAVLRALEDRAKSARQEMARLDASLADLERNPARQSTRERHESLVAECRAARGAAESRLTEVVTVLETLRLDLLRLHAGMGTVESITLDLAAADGVGRDTERLLAARREVDDLIAPRTLP